jgi:hypothetical protein
MTLRGLVRSRRRVAYDHERPQKMLSRCGLALDVLRMTEARGFRCRSRCTQCFLCAVSFDIPQAIRSPDLSAQFAPASIQDSPVHSRLRRYVPARILDGSGCARSHVRDSEVFHDDNGVGRRLPYKVRCSGSGSRRSATGVAGANPHLFGAAGLVVVRRPVLFEYC